jgi:hypothetical protein
MWLGGSSGESTWFESSTPFSLPWLGSGAFRQACADVISTAPGRGGRATLCSTYLDQVLALSLGDERLKLWRCERVDKARLGHHEQ